MISPFIIQLLERLYGLLHDLALLGLTFSLIVLIALMCSTLYRISVLARAKRIIGSKILLGIYDIGLLYSLYVLLGMQLSVFMYLPHFPAFIPTRGTECILWAMIFSLTVMYVSYSKERR